MGTVETVSEGLVSGGGLARYELGCWEETYGVVAGVTGRGNDADFGLAPADAANQTLQRWSTLAGCLGSGFRSIVVSRQVHGAAIQERESCPDGLLIGDGFDGHLTVDRGVLLCLTVADCVPVYLIEPGSGWLGLLHAGWRGTAAGIVERGIRRIGDLGGVPASGIVMHCGVGICGACYEVSPEVASAVTGETASGPTLLDLRRELVTRARRLGVEQVSVSDHCSAHGPGEFYSHRAMRGRAGRMVAYLGRPTG